MFGKYQQEEPTSFDLTLGFLQIFDVLLNVTQVSNDTLLKELQRQNKEYLEKIIEQNEQILKKINNKEKKEV